MSSFWNGFEKQAVSLGWINKKLEGGLKQRLKDKGKDLIKKLKGASKTELAEQAKSLGKSTKELEKTHWRKALTEGESQEGARRSLHDEIKALAPKAKVEGRAEAKFNSTKKLLSAKNVALAAGGTAAGYGGIKYYQHKKDQQQGASNV